jgi:hypothetical protein
MRCLYFFFVQSVFVFVGRPSPLMARALKMWSLGDSSLDPLVGAERARAGKSAVTGVEADGLGRDEDEEGLYKFNAVDP